MIINCILRNLLFIYKKDQLKKIRMELEIIERLENDSKLSSGYDFVSKNKSFSVPYLTFLSFLTIVGTVGNFLVLGTLLILKVESI